MSIHISAFWQMAGGVGQGLGQGEGSVLTLTDAKGRTIVYPDVGIRQVSANLAQTMVVN